MSTQTAPYEGFVEVSCSVESILVHSGRLSALSVLRVSDENPAPKKIVWGTQTRTGKTYIALVAYPSVDGGPCTHWVPSSERSGQNAGHAFDGYPEDEE